MKISMQTLIAAIVVAAAACWLPGISEAAGEPVGVFTRVEGNVDILHTRDIGAQPVRPGDPVFMADAIRTKRDSKAEIQFKDDTTLQLAPETRIVIDEYTYQGNVRQKGFLSLLRGKVRAIVSKAKAAVIPVAQSESNFMVRTPTAIAGVKGTDIIVSFERGISAVFFLDGFGFVFNPTHPDRVVPVHRGQGTFVLGRDKTPLIARLLPVSLITPYIKGTTPSGPSTGAGEGGGESSPPPGGASSPDGTILSGTNVVLENTGFTVQIDSESVIVVMTPPSGGTMQAGMDLPGSGQGPAGGGTVLIPFTETHPEALNQTNVTVKVHIP